MNLITGKALSNSLSQDIKLIILTPKGERLLNKDYGSNVENALAFGVNRVFEVCSQVLADLKQSGLAITKVVPLEESNLKQGVLTVRVDIENNKSVKVEL